MNTSLKVNEVLSLRNLDLDRICRWNWEHINLNTGGIIIYPVQGETKEAGIQSEKSRSHKEQGRDREIARAKAREEGNTAALVSSSFLFLALDHCHTWIFSLISFCEIYSWPLSNMGLSCTVPFIDRFLYKYSCSKCLFFMIFLVTFSLAYFTIRMQYIIHIQNACPLTVC